MRLARPGIAKTSKMIFKVVRTGLAVILSCKGRGNLSQMPIQRMVRIADCAGTEAVCLALSGLCVDSSKWRVVEAYVVLANRYNHAKSTRPFLSERPVKQRRWTE